ncbi:hypothetical protein EG346_13210 [Chryseobacterium carnipullorum]|uniref:YcxB family protein n=1 Tax=Chryseobacterium carnipullorum TaxID=1124835 RepID=A0A376DR78_CHRCU|nr:hypothetical protein [Chryseobacterium carnipullorum]AZA49072.1 hypothetical protein EG346_13210 [Chryseobacterium carnipullorum]STC93863.1 Uncharacterised protein [Chryseobacterium carnipullorum]
MNGDKVIKLNVSRKDFEEIYFSGNQGSLFFSQTTKGKTVTTAVVGLILLILFFFKDDLSKEKFGILYFVSFLFLLCTVYLSLSINKVSRWKKEVNRYLKSLEDAEIYEIRFNSEIFNVNLNHQEELSKWEDFKDFEVNDEFISLEGKFNYMFPKKSMSKADYEILKQAVKKNIKQ